MVPKQLCEAGSRILSGHTLTCPPTSVCVLAAAWESIWCALEVAAAAAAAAAATAAAAAASAAAAPAAAAKICRAVLASLAVRVNSVLTPACAEVLALC